MNEKVQLTRRFRNSYVQDFEAVAKPIGESPTRLFAQRRVGFDGDDLTTLLQIICGVIAVMHSDIVDDRHDASPSTLYRAAI
jgi:hypothetical protein